MIQATRIALENEMKIEDITLGDFAAKLDVAGHVAWSDSSVLLLALPADKEMASWNSMTASSGNTATAANRGKQPFVQHDMPEPLIVYSLGVVMIQLLMPNSDFILFNLRLGQHRNNPLFQLSMSKTKSLLTKGRSDKEAAVIDYITDMMMSGYPDERPKLSVVELKFAELERSLSLKI